MDLKYLPVTGIRLSRLTLGTMMFGGQTDESESLRIMDLAFERGINAFDTANAYNQGESERIVGKGLKGRRNHVILATKVYGQMGKDLNDMGLSRRNILAAADESLRRLDTDYIDIYYLHSPDKHTPVEESLYAMDSLIRTGKVRYVGISNFAAWQAADVLHIGDKRGYSAPVITQNVYNLLTRGIEAEFLPFLRAHPMGMAVYNPLAGGLLAGKHRVGKPEEDTRFALNKVYYQRYWSDENFDAVEHLQTIAGENELSLLQLSYKWLAMRPEVSTIICGVSKLSQLEENLGLLEGPALNEQTLAACDDLWQQLAGTRFAYNR